MKRSTKKVLAYVSVAVGLTAAGAMIEVILSVNRNPPIGAAIFAAAVVGFGIAFMFLGVAYRIAAYIQMAEATLQYGRKTPTIPALPATDDDDGDEPIPD